MVMNLPLNHCGYGYEYLLGAVSRFVAALVRTGSLQVTSPMHTIDRMIQRSGAHMIMNALNKLADQTFAPVFLDMPYKRYTS